MTELLGDRIRKARVDYGMSQAELTRRVAKQIAVSKQTIYDIESNRTRNPGVLYIQAIANVLRLSVDELLGQDNKESELIPAAVA
jgi:transcriptional regulator with XRE-family HTH domain